MDLQSRKLDLIQEFLKIKSEDLIDQIEGLIKKSRAKNIDLKPLTQDELDARINESLKDIETGRVISHEEVMRKINL